MTGTQEAAPRAGWRTVVSGVFSPVGRRASWTMADQGLSSITNFALSVFVARTVDPREFGAFGLVFAAYLLLLNLSRALGAEPLMIRFSAAEPAAQRAAISASTGLAVVIGLISAAVVALIAVAAGGATKGALLALAITLPGLLLQDAWRFVFFTVARPASAAANDAAWAVAQVVAFVVLYVHGVRTVAPLVLGWGIAACVAGAFGVFQSRVMPSLVAGVRWLVTHRDIGPLLALEYFAGSSTGQLTLFAVAGIAGLASVASLRAADIVLGPLGVINMAILAVALPELLRVHARDPDRMPKLAMLVGVVIAVSALLVGIVAFFIPNSIGEAFLRDNWIPAHEVIIPYALALAFSGLMTGAVLQMRVLQAIKETLTLRIAFAVASVGGASVGVYFWGVKGAAWGLAISGAVFAWLNWMQAAKVLRRQPTRPTV